MKFHICYHTNDRTTFQTNRIAKERKKRGDPCQAKKIAKATNNRERTTPFVKDHLRQFDQY